MMTFDEYAALDADTRGPAADLPTREEVENGLPVETAPAPVQCRTAAQTRSAIVFAANTRTRGELAGFDARDDSRFAITDEASANWYLGKRAAVETEKGRIKAQFAARIAELEADEARLIARFDGELAAWAKAEATARRRQTVTLLQGSVCFRKVAARFVIADAEAAFVNARTVCPDAVKRTETITLDRAAYLAFAEATGDLTGVDRVPEKETFAVKFPGAKDTPQ